MREAGVVVRYAAFTSHWASDSPRTHHSRKEREEDEEVARDGEVVLAVALVRHEADLCA